MNPALSQFLIGLAGVVIGGFTVWIAFRKLPSEITQNESVTMLNLVNTVKGMTEENKRVRDKVNELESLVHGTYEIRALVTLSNPPKMLEASIRLVEPAVKPV